VIDEDEEEDDGMGPKDSRDGRDVDPNKIGVSKTDSERAQALAMHTLAGLRKGDRILINRETLPGAVLFPAIKYKEVIEEGKEAEALSSVSADDKEEVKEEQTASDPLAPPATATAVDVANTEAEAACTVDRDSSSDAPAPAQAPAQTHTQDAHTQDHPLTQSTTTPSQAHDAPLSPVSGRLAQVHRFLVVTRERFIVLDSQGAGVGSEATVKSNHHLTEVNGELELELEL
jgi:hypothetical protein